MNVEAVCLHDNGKELNQNDVSQQDALMAAAEQLQYRTSDSTNYSARLGANGVCDRSWR